MDFKLVKAAASFNRSWDTKVAQLLSDADRARDERRWRDAAKHYGAYLESRPQDAAIWVQYGHALKESGDLDAAEAAYKQSLTLSPEVADTHLQLGHLCKLKRNFSGAIAAYREALRIDSKLLDAMHELSALGIDPGLDANAKALIKARKKPALIVDLSDVFFYLEHHKTVSGIQRVQLGIAKAIIDGEAGTGHNCLFVAEGHDRRGYVVLEDVFLNELCKELMKETVEHNRLKDLMRSARELAHTYDPIKGDTLLMLGAFWVLEGVAERIVALKKMGVNLGVLIHDIIPITHPEFCEKSLTDEFKSYFDSVISISDFVLTISDHSGRAVRRFIAQNNLPDTPVRTIRSAHKTWDAPEDGGALAADVAKLVQEDYVLYVSTIEIRKNHTYLFRIWKRLIEERGRKNVPTLVFVGRPGWRVKDLMDQLGSTENLNGKIKILHDLPDNELAALYRSALFSVFPSFEEGWGLPVGESLIFGRPCLASNSSSVPEVGGEFVDYVDPFNINDGYEKISRLIDDGDYREKRAAKIKEHFVERGWPDVARDMLKLINGLLSEHTATKVVELPRLKPGRKYNFGNNGNKSRFIETGDARIVHFAFDPQWYPVEDFGRWMRAPKARIEFAVEKGAGESVMLLLEGSCVPWLASTGLKICVNDTAYTVPVLKKGLKMMFLLEAPCPDGKLEIEFESAGKIAEGSDPRKDLFFGLCSLSYAPVTDIMSRLRMLEELILSSNNGTMLTADTESA